MYISALASDFYSQVSNAHSNANLDRDGLLGLLSTRNVDLYLYHMYKEYFNVDKWSISNHLWLKRFKISKPSNKRAW